MTVAGTILEGDNKEFAVTTVSDVTVNFNNGSFTSADDTATNKYLSNPMSPEFFAIRPNKAIKIVSINAIEFTDPISIGQDTTYAEFWNRGIRKSFLNKMVLRTTTTNTLIKLRVR